LIVLEDALLEGEHSIDEPSLYLLWTRASRAEIELPRPLAEIEATFHAIARARHECGVAERRSRLLVNRARLALSRGRLAQAIAYGEEALERQPIESSTYSIGAHYWPLIAAYTWAGELTQARRHPERWQRHGAARTPAASAGRGPRAGRSTLAR
jgi:tetratricopeptide (TPR) repeat protein